MKDVKFSDEDRKMASYDTFQQSVQDRRSMCAESFTYSSKGFEATIKLDSPNIVFFSVSKRRRLVGHRQRRRKRSAERILGRLVAVECGRVKITLCSPTIPPV
jgi:hypothetical protein